MHHNKKYRVTTSANIITAAIDQCFPGEYEIRNMKMKVVVVVVDLLDRFCIWYLDYCMVYLIMNTMAKVVVDVVVVVMVVIAIPVLCQ